MEKLGIFGGTFNPVHNGHLSLCTQLADALEIPKVLLIPTAIPPHKRAPELASGEHRLAMCRLAAQSDPRFCACDLELRRQGNSYTVETLRELGRLSPSAQLFLLMGTDMFMTVQNWYCACEIFRRAFLVAGARQEGEEKQPTTNNISINEGVNKYKESEHETFKNAITRELSMQIGKDDNITLNANGSKTDNGYIVYTFVIKENEENIVTTQAYIIGDYKYVLIHETTYTSDTEESDQAFKNMVNTFKWNE